MARDAETKVTTAAVGNREDLSDVTVRIYADQMPFMAMAGKGTAKATDHEWVTTEIRAGALGNAQPEGAKARRTNPKTRVRLKNTCQIFDEYVSVSKTQEAVDKAAIKSELKEQKKLKLIEMNLDREVTYCSAQERAAETGTADGEGRKMSGIQCFANVSGNTSRGTGGTDGTVTNGYAGAPTAGTNRTFTEDLLQEVMLGMFQNGAGGNKTAMMGARLKQVASGFTGIAENRRPLTGRGKAVIIAAADVIVTDFGELTMAAHQSAFQNECLILQERVVKIGKLRGTTYQKLAKTGDSDEGEYVCEDTLVVTNPKGVGIIADLIAA